MVSVTNKADHDFLPEDAKKFDNLANSQSPPNLALSHHAKPKQSSRRITLWSLILPYHLRLFLFLPTTALPLAPIGCESLSS